MFTSLAYKYATFRNKNMMIGRVFELIVVLVFFTSCFVPAMTNNINVIFCSFGVMILCCLMSFFFKKADELRRSMPN